MRRTIRALVGALMALACLASAAQAEDAVSGRPVTIDDIVELEAFGRATISPDGRWVVYEKRGAYDTASRFDLAARAPWTIMDLWLVDLSAPGRPPERLLPGEGLGLQRIAWSPDGGRLLISRLRGDDFEFGVVAMADRSVVWTGLTPEVPPEGATAEWVSAHEVVVLTRPDRSLPVLIRRFSGTQARMTEAWRRSALGREPSRTLIDARGGVVRPETPDEGQALVGLDLETGRRRRLAEGRISDFAVAPDGSAVAVVQATDRPTVRGAPRVQLEGDKRQTLVLIGLDGDRRTEVASDWEVASNLLRWSPDSRAVLIWARRDGADWTAGRLLIVGFDDVAVPDLGDLTPGTAEAIVAGVRADWLGDTPVIYARPRGGIRFDWALLGTGAAPRVLTATLATAPPRLAATSAEALLVVADGAVWRIQRDGAPERTAGRTAFQEAIPSDAERVGRFRGNDAPRRNWAAVLDADGESFVAERGGVRSIGAGADARPRVLAVSGDAALVLERVGLAETLMVRQGGDAWAIDAVNTDKRNIRLIEPMAISHLDTEGRATRSWLYLPPGPIRGLIVRVYPGAADSFVWWDPLTLTYGTRSTVLAAAGFAVLSPSMNVDASPGKRGDLYVRAVDLAVDAALAAHPELPSGRMAIYGHSFGGYATLEIATRSNRYQSYIASASLSDFPGHWGGFAPTARIQPEDRMSLQSGQAFTEAGQGGFGVPPWLDLDAYLQSSPYLRADRVTAPVLLLTADLDFVPPTQAEQMFSALAREGKTARIVTFWGEHHHAWSPANIRERYRLIFDWLDETLPGAGLTTTASAGPPTGAPSSQKPPPP